MDEKEKKKNINKRKIEKGRMKIRSREEKGGEKKIKIKRRKIEEEGDKNRERGRDELIEEKEEEKLR